MLRSSLICLSILNGKSSFVVAADLLLLLEAVVDAVELPLLLSPRRRRWPTAEGLASRSSRATSGTGIREPFSLTDGQMNQ